MSLISPITAIILPLGLIEATAYWWMHPSKEASASPVLTYVPTSINDEAAFPKITPLPELYTQSAPMLRCTGGKVWHVQQNETVGLHLAFFEWDGTDTGSVLEAFRHAPEACMGSIGMKLISREKPITYIVGAREDPKTTASSSSHFSLLTSHSRSFDSSSSTDHRSLITSHSENTTLVFEHTIFLDPEQGAGTFQPKSPRLPCRLGRWQRGSQLPRRNRWRNPRPTHHHPSKKHTQPLPPHKRPRHPRRRPRSPQLRSRLARLRTIPSHRPRFQVAAASHS